MTAPGREWSPLRVYRQPAGRVMLESVMAAVEPAVRRGAAPAMLLAAAAAILALVLANLTGCGRAPAARPLHARAARRPAVEVRPQPAHPVAAAQPPHPPAPPQAATLLESQGHQLLSSGSYSAAIPVLRQAIQATGVAPGACLEPRTPGCVIYAFALYDLGRALRLSGDPAAAIPILERRLLIDNRRDIVAYELGLARHEAG